MGDREAWWARVHALAQHAPHIALQIVGGRIVAHAASRLFGTAAAWGLREVLGRRSPRRTCNPTFLPCRTCNPTLLQTDCLQAGVIQWTFWLSALACATLSLPEFYATVSMFYSRYVK